MSLVLLVASRGCDALTSPSLTACSSWCLESPAPHTDGATHVFPGETPDRAYKVWSRISDCNPYLKSVLRSGNMGSRGGLYMYMYLGSSTEMVDLDNNLSTNF